MPNGLDAPDAVLSYVEADLKLAGDFTGETKCKAFGLIPVS